MKTNKKLCIAALFPRFYGLTRLCLASLALALAMVHNVAASSAKKEVKIGVLAMRGGAEARNMWNATSQYLAKNIPGYSFTMIPYEYRTITSAAQRGEFDFVIVNSSIYFELEALYGVTRMATLKGLNPGKAATLFGGVVFCKKDRKDINELADIKGKSVMATEENSFGGWLIPWREFHAIGIDPYRDFRKLEFAGTHDGVVYGVRDGKADAGTVRTGILEAMDKEGKIKLKDYKIINQKYHEQFNLIHSTRLYPEWAFARLRHTDETLAQKVVIALFKIEISDEAAIAARIAGWTTPHDYNDVGELFKDLKIGPYKEYGKISVAMVLVKYRYPIAGGLTFVLLMMVFSGFMLRLNDKLNRSNIEREKVYQDLKSAESQILQNDKMASIGQLAAGVAHEINNPCGFILSNLNSLRRYVERVKEFLTVQGEALAGLPPDEVALVENKKKSLKINYIIEDMASLVNESYEGAERIKNIVKDLKNFSHVNESEMSLTDINAGIESTLNIVWNEIKYKAVVKKEFGNIPQIQCNSGQINQVVLNMLVNAAQAMEKQGEITVRTWSDDQSIYIAIADTGPGIPPDIMGRLFEPFFTTKEVGKGTGLGLSIAYDIVKKHNGEIMVESEVCRGTTFTIRLPLNVESSSSREMWTALDI